MRAGLIALIVVIGVALIIVATGAMTDAANVDVISPMPSPYPQDTTSDVMTLQDDAPLELSPEMREVAIVDEITDFGRDVSSNQVQQAEDATGALTTVSVASYAAIASIVGGYNARDIMLAVALCVALYLGLKMMTAKKHDGGER